MTEPVSEQESQAVRDEESEIVRNGPGLRRRHVTMIAIGGIIGASLFVGSGSVIAAVGPAALISYALGGLLVLLVMRMLGEIAAARPTLGSFMEYARDGLGEGAGFVVGWLYWYFWVGVVAFEAVVGGGVIGGWLGAPPWIFSLVLMAILTLSNLYSTRSFGEVEFWLASIKVATIIVFLVAGVLFVLGIWPHAHFSVPTIVEHGFMPHGVVAVIQGVVTVIFAYFGTEIVTMAAAESAEPAAGVRRATNSVVWRILLFYVGSVALLLMITPWRQIPSDSSPFAAAFTRFGIPAAGTIMNVVVLTAALSVLNSGIYTSSRMLFALSGKGWAPTWVNRRSRRGVPYAAVLLSTVIGYIAIAMNYFMPSQIFSFIMNSAGAVALLVYLVIAITQLRLRARMSPEETAQLKLKMWGHPWLGILVIIGVVGVITSMALIPGVRSQLVLTMISLAVVIGAFLLLRATRGNRRVLRRPGDRVTRPGGR